MAQSPTRLGTRRCFCFESLFQHILLQKWVFLFRFTNSNTFIVIKSLLILQHCNKQVGGNNVNLLIHILNCCLIKNNINIIKILSRLNQILSRRFYWNHNLRIRQFVCHLKVSTIFPPKTTQTFAHRHICLRFHPSVRNKGLYSHFAS